VRGTAEITKNLRRRESGVIKFHHTRERKELVPIHNPLIMRRNAIASHWFSTGIRRMGSGQSGTQDESTSESSRREVRNSQGGDSNSYRPWESENPIYRYKKHHGGGMKTRRQRGGFVTSNI